MEFPQTGIDYAFYVCGNRRCGKQISLTVQDVIKCDKCGYRILYKKKKAHDSQPIQYQAI